ncbi:metalloregulator ArsR/SmtB family transcription factor [Haloarcula sp. S1AR25-5A]|uniref:Metalloregulator ArsR/SmtB family transcription factor n=1 Tax=Haloarcula terrestris TaxID=2950533 RepID=A0AAE4JFP5_9EURY|nr:metalloregulator ArsR/SmtB family transcription factor [Haloarcula terrestris]MDS0219770.1 metalloregulator ArsR/SmtB family transcription factor [Haloarcula terrestris]
MSADRPETQSPERDSQESTCCPSVDHSLSEDDLAADVQTLATLGTDTRYEALRLIAGADEAVCVCELEPALGVSQGAVSQALSRLFSAGLVERRKEGRWRYYTATRRAQRLLGVLDETREGASD